MKIRCTIMAGLALGALTTSAFAETTLRYSNWLPATHPFVSEVIQPWIEDVSRVTEGRVTIEILPKVVGTVPTQFEVVRDGLADVTLIVDGYSPGRFNLNGIVELPFLGNDARSISAAYWRIYKKYLEKFGEYENAIPVAKVTGGPMALSMGSARVTTIDDFNGLKIRVPNATGSKVVAALGGAPVNKPISEMYELISTGVVDGMISTTETINSFSIGGSIQSVLTVPGGFGGSGVSFIVNQEALSELSEKDQEAFWSVSGEVFSTRIAEIYNDLNQRGKKDVLDNGGTIEPASAELTAALKEKLSPLDLVWIDKAKELGLENAGEVLEEFRAEIAKVEAELGVK